MGIFKKPFDKDPYKTKQYNGKYRRVFLVAQLIWKDANNSHGTDGSGRFTHTNNLRFERNYVGKYSSPMGHLGSLYRLLFDGMLLVGTILYAQKCKIGRVVAKACGWRIYDDSWFDRFGLQLQENLEEQKVVFLFSPCTIVQSSLETTIGN